MMMNVEEVHVTRLLTDGKVSQWLPYSLARLVKF